MHIRDGEIQRHRGNSPRNETAPTISALWLSSLITRLWSLPHAFPKTPYRSRQAGPQPRGAAEGDRRPGESPAARNRQGWISRRRQHDDRPDAGLRFRLQPQLPRQLAGAKGLGQDGWDQRDTLPTHHRGPQVDGTDRGPHDMGCRRQTRHEGSDQLVDDFQHRPHHPRSGRQGPRDRQTEAPAETLPV